jgi:hypothetical protein
MSYDESQIDSRPESATGNYSKYTLKNFELTNTFKLTHRNEQNTNETSYLSGEEIHIRHALSV